MSIVAFDGAFLATDKMAVSGDMQASCRKSRVIGHVVVAWTGSLDTGEAMARWFERGEKPEEFPPGQRTDNWSRLVVASRDGVWYYEKEPVKIELEDMFMAWGAGRDFAMGAMAMGANAKKAVEIASRFSVCCGNGVDVYDLLKL